MLGGWIKELLLAAGQSFRILIRGKKTWVLLMAGVVLLVGMLVCMDEVKEEKSRIAIGFVNEDDSELSKSVIEQMKQMDLYEVTEGSQTELITLLTEGGLSAVCVLKDGFSKDLEKGETDKLVTIYEVENEGALLLGDVLAGAMMQEICIAKGYLVLREYEDKTGREASLSLEEYRNYVKELFLEGETEFSFDISYVSPNREQMDKPEQTLIYEQAIFAVFALMAGLLSVYAVLPFRRMRYGRLAEKIRTLPMKESAMYLGSALSAFVLPALFGLVFLGCFYIRNEVETQVFVSLLVCTGLYICVIVCIMLLAAYVIRSQTVYQMGMLAMILVFGILGLVSLVDGLLLPEGTVTWVPNGWYVRKMTELLN